MRQMRLLSAVVPGLLVISGLSLAACDQSSSGGSAAPTSTTPTTAASAAAPTTASAAPSAAPSAAASAETPSADTAAEDKEAADEVRDHHRHHHHAGVMMFVSMAIDTLGVPAEKKAQLEKIQGDLHAKMQPARDAEHDLLQILADGTAAGKIDTAKVDAALAKLDTARKGIHAASMDTLTRPSARRWSTR
jgi:hypothetical protein